MPTLVFFAGMVAGAVTVLIALYLVHVAKPVESVPPIVFDELGPYRSRTSPMGPGKGPLPARPPQRGACPVCGGDRCVVSGGRDA